MIGNKPVLMLRLLGLTTIRHGRSLSITVSGLTTGTRVTLYRQLEHGARTSFTRTARLTRVTFTVAFPSKGTYAITASGSNPNYVVHSVVGSVKAT